MTERRSDLVDERRLVASRRHTIILTAVLLVIALAGFLSAAGASNVRSAAMPSGLMLYLSILAAELGLLFYVRLGLHKHGTSMRDIISARPLSISGVITDVLLGAVLLGLWFGLEYLLTRWAGPSGAEHTRPLLVRKAWEIPIWILLALTAGFAEEVTFRGYYQRQFGALLRSPGLGVGAQAFLFGLTHGYQGTVLVIKIMLFGVMFGAFALLRRSLIPGIVAHASVDVVGGLTLFR